MHKQESIHSDTLEGLFYQRAFTPAPRFYDSWVKTIYYLVSCRFSALDFSADQV